MSTKPKYFLLDAGPVIELHRLGLWDEVTDRCDLVIPSVVAYRESQFWVREDGSHHAIDPTASKDYGRLTVPRFCCADRMAVICLCLLRFSSLAVSLEEVLSEIGLGCALQSKFTDAALAKWVDEGKDRLIRGEGLA